jgi:hypothetical protein
VHHSTSFLDPEDRELDLHWYSLWHSAPDEDFWQAAVPIEISDASSLALCPADQLLHVCAHGAWWAPEGSIGWVADATRIIRTGLDWGRFCSSAAARRIAGLLGEPLAYLKGEFEAPVPDEVIAELARCPRSLLERAAWRAGRVPSSPLGITLTHLERYRRLKRLDPDAPRPSSFPKHLAGWFGYDDYLSFSRFAGRQVVQRRRRTGQSTT